MHPAIDGARARPRAGIRVALCVLLPGEATRPAARTRPWSASASVATAPPIVGGERIAVGQYDAWNIPSYRTSWHVNDGDELHVRLEYSNAPRAREAERPPRRAPQPPEEPPIAPRSATTDEADGDPRRRSPYGTFELNDDGAMLMPYERLINPPAVASRALHWPWADVKAHLDELEALGPTTSAAGSTSCTTR